MMRLLAFVFSATLFSFVLAQEASALRGGGIHVGGGGLRGFRPEPIAAVCAPGILAAIVPPPGEGNVTGAVLGAGMGTGPGRRH
jgi:hypothetical protein